MLKFFCHGRLLIVALSLCLVPAALTPDDGGISKKERAEIKKFLSTTINAYEGLSKSLKKAKKPNEVAKAIDTFADQLIKIKKDFTKIQEKYKDIAEEEVPKDMEPLIKKLNTAIENFQNEATPILEKFATDPAVQKAAQRMADALADPEEE